MTNRNCTILSIVFQRCENNHYLILDYFSLVAFEFDLSALSSIFYDITYVIMFILES